MPKGVWVRVPPDRQINNKEIILWKAGLKEWLMTEFNYSNLKKYRPLFEEWFKNLTPNQVLYYEGYMRGEKTPWNGDFDNFAHNRR